MPRGRWEHGSDFEWIAWPPAEEPRPNPWREEGRLCGSGRDALAALLRYGAGALGWQRLWLPSYFCQTVARHLAGVGVAMAAYDDLPTLASPRPMEIAAEPGDVVLIVNHFGTRHPPARVPSGLVVIEDHTHDPWSTWAYQSRADYCVASLRKTLPLPDGGVLWSPTGGPLPDQPGISAEHGAATANRLAASVLKRVYLDGYDVPKGDFRSLFLEGEAQMGTGEPSGMSAVSVAMLGAFPIHGWRERRRHGYDRLAGQLVDVPGLVEKPALDRRSTPFSLRMLFESRDRRDAVRQDLTHRGVYTAVLWNLERPVAGALPATSVELSRRMLSIPCDGRYDDAGLDRVAALVRAAVTRPSEIPG